MRSVGKSERRRGVYWVQATEAEASLVLGQVDAALEAYAKAVGMEDAQPAHVASTREVALPEVPPSLRKVT